MSEEIWVFTSNNCRKVPGPWSAYELNPFAYLNPDRSDVRGYSPHFWKPPADGQKVGGKFVLMSGIERADRLLHHRRHGVDNMIPEAPLPAKAPIAFSRNPIAPVWAWIWAVVSRWFSFWGRK